MLKSIVPYYGGKRMLASFVNIEMGPHRTADWDVFCGSLARFFDCRPTAHEFACDLHDDVTNLCYALRDDKISRRLYNRCHRTLFHELLFKDSAAFLRDNLPYEFDGQPNEDRAYHYLVVSWMGRNGIAGTVKAGDNIFASRWSATGGHGAVRWSSATDSILAWHARLHRVNFLHRSAFDVLPRIRDARGTSIYCDPPYLRDGDARSSTDQYLHDFKLADHYRLAEMLARFQQARVVVSYYDHSLLGRLYPSAEGWTKVDLSRTKNLAFASPASPENKRTIAREALLVNGRSYLADPQLKLFA